MSEHHHPDLSGAAEKVYDRMLAQVEAALGQADAPHWSTVEQEVDRALEEERQRQEVSTQELDKLGDLSQTGSRPSGELCSRDRRQCRRLAEN